MSLTIPAALPTQASASAQASDLSRQSLGTDYDNFLKLLVAQVQNQDPLEPMDSTTFVSQLAQLSQVEQAIQTNKNLESISGRMDSVTAFADLGLLGRTVRVEGDQTELRGGAAVFSYTPAAPAAPNMGPTTARSAVRERRPTFAAARCSAVETALGDRPSA